MHFSDSLTAEAMKYGYELVNDRGMVVRRVPRQLNAEERAAANKLAAEQEAKRRAAPELANAEAQMLSAYTAAESYKISQQPTLDNIDHPTPPPQVQQPTQKNTPPAHHDTAP